MNKYHMISQTYAMVRRASMEANKKYTSLPISERKWSITYIEGTQVWTDGSRNRWYDHKNCQAGTIIVYKDPAIYPDQREYPVNLYKLTDQDGNPIGFPQDTESSDNAYWESLISYANERGY